MHFMPSTLTKIPVDLCVGPTTTLQKVLLCSVGILCQDSYGPMPPPNVGLSEAQRWATLFFFKRLRKQPGRGDMGEIFLWISMVGLGCDGSGRIQIIVYEFLAILMLLKFERLKKLGEIRRTIQERVRDILNT